MEIRNKDNLKFISIVAYLTIFITILSQTQIAFFRKSMYLAFIFLFTIILVKNKLIIRTTPFMNLYIISVFAFISYIMIIKIFNNNYKIQIVSVLLTSLFMYILGSQLAFAKVDEKIISKILIVYIIGCIILALYIKMKYFPSLLYWLDSMTNIYDKKNSVAQILSIGVIILIFYFNNFKNRYIKVLKFISITILGYVLILMQSRASMISLLVAILIYCLNDKKNRFRYILYITILLIILLGNKYTWAIIEKFFYLNKYEGTSLNAFSSNRFEWYYYALIKWKEHIFIGSGLSYVDNLYINLLTSSGIIGIFVIIPVWIYRIVLNNKMYNRHKVKNKLYLILKLLTIFLLMESMFEGFPPFGPGVCSFIFWLICGYIDVYSKNIQ